MDFRPSPAQQLLDRHRARVPAPALPARARAATGARRARLRPRRSGAAWPSSAGRACSSRPSSAAATARCSTWSCSSRRWATPCLPGPFVDQRGRRHLAAARRGKRGAAEAPAARAGHRRAHRHAGARGGERLVRSRRRSRCACDVPGRLTGRKLFVKDAHVADDLIVAVRDGGGLSLLVVPTDRRGHRAAAARRDQRREALRGDVRRRGDRAPTTGSAPRARRRARWPPALARRRAGADGGDGRRRPAHPRAGRRARARRACRAGARSAATRPSSTPAPTSCATSTRARGLLYRGRLEGGRGPARRDRRRHRQGLRRARRAWPWRAAVIRSSAPSATARSTRSTCSTSASRPRALDFGDAQHHLETVAKSIGLV